VHDAHGHSHGLVDPSIRRSHAGMRAVAGALGPLGATAAAQALVFALSGSVALLADLIHNAGDVLTAVPLGVAFLLRPERAALVRTRAGRRLRSAALIADGNHARADAWVSLAVAASAAVVALGVPVADPLIGLAITLVILRITWQSWRTIRGHDHHR